MRKPNQPRTPAQQEASRRNGARSRGPITAEGKNKIRFNAEKHGLTSKIVRLSIDSEDMCNIHWASVLDTLQPVNDLEFMAAQEYMVG